MRKLRNSSKEDSNTGSLDCEFGIVPLSLTTLRVEFAQRNMLISVIVVYISTRYAPCYTSVIKMCD